MLRWIVGGLLMFGLLGCTELPPPPGTGGGGDGGGGSSGAGGSGGSGGESGSGGQGGTVQACTGLVPEKLDSLEQGDTVEEHFVLGKVSGVCPNQNNCEGDDPFDRWTFTSCIGSQSVELWWDEDMHDLNLYVFTEHDGTVDQAAEATEGNFEDIALLDQEEQLPLVIQVQANGTGGVEQSYCLEIIPLGAGSGAERHCSF